MGLCINCSFLKNTGGGDVGWSICKYWFKKNNMKICDHPEDDKCIYYKKKWYKFWVK